jgi:hypothetical protein
MLWRKLMGEEAPHRMLEIASGTVGKEIWGRRGIDAVFSGF